MVECMWHRCARQTALERQDLSIMYLAHHELDSESIVVVVMIIRIIITIIIIINIIIIVIIIIIIMWHRSWA